MDILTINDRPGEYPDSYYVANADIGPGYPRAEGNIEADICVVGGGFSGLAAALFLARQGFSVVLLEASRIGFGASGRNGGQVGVGQRCDQLQLEAQFGKQRARELWDISLESVELVKELVAQSGLDCDITPGILATDHRQRYTRETQDYVEHLQSNYDYDQISYLDHDQVRQEVGSPGFYSGALDLGSFHIQPLKFVLALAKLAREAGVKIYEKSRMTQLVHGDTVTIRTDRAVIRAKYCVLGMNGYHNNIDKTIEQKVMPINNYIAVTEPFDNDFARSLIRNNYAVVDSRFVVNYFRLTPDNRMLFGGGESYSYKFPDDLVAKVSKPMLEVYPQLKGCKIDYAWGGTLGITRSRLPHFCRIKNNVLSVSGYSGHGVALAALGGKMAAAAIAGQAKQFDVMAQIPTRNFPGGAKLRYPALVAGMLWYSMLDKL